MTSARAGPGAQAGSLARSAVSGPRACAPLGAGPWRSRIRTTTSRRVLACLLQDERYSCPTTCKAIRRCGGRMLNFDEPRFREIQAGAVELADAIDHAVNELLDAGAKNLFFLGTGGAGVLMQPAAELLQRRAGLPTFLEHAAEIVLSDSVHLGHGSVVVIPSLSGTTKESVELLRFAQAKGAKVITLTGHR